MPDPTEHSILAAWLTAASIDFLQAGPDFAPEPGRPDFLIFTQPPDSNYVRGVVIEFTDRDDHETGSLMDRIQGHGWAAIVATDAAEAITWLTRVGYYRN